MSVHHPNRPQHEHGRHLSEFQIVGALLLIALGVVFLALNTGYLSHSANWWVIFLLFPGVGLLWNAVSNARQVGRVPSGEVLEGVVGVSLLLLSFIFIFDPTWSFTRTLNMVFPHVNWSLIWPFFIIVPGLVLLVTGIVREWFVAVVIGALTVMVGAVFALNIDWNIVWPLAIIIPGIWLLYRNFRPGE